MSWRTPFSRPRRHEAPEPDDREGGAAGARWTSRSRAARILVGVAGALVLVLASWLVYLWITWPDVPALATKNPETTAFIERYREARRQQGESDRAAWQWTTNAQISPHLKRAVVAGEDLEFFSHSGFSVSEMRAALREVLADGELRGASTITQQLAKNLWLTPSRSPWRKIKEAILTRQLEQHLSKRRILELYLNVVEFGPGVYGAGTAARHYFGKPAAALSEHEAAMLAAALPRPSQWHPGRDTPGYLRYVAEIERRMARAAFLWRHVAPSARPGAPDSVPRLSTATDSPVDPLTAMPGDSVGSDVGSPIASCDGTTDRIVTDATTLVLRVQVPHGPYLVVRDPDGVPYVVVGPAMGGPSTFPELPEIAVAVDTLRGLPWGAGDSWQPVFRRSGLYVVSIGDSLAGESAPVDLRVRVVYCPQVLRP